MDGQVRIVGSPTPKLGRVEVCFNRTWGTYLTHNKSLETLGAVAGKNGFTTSLIPTNIDSINCIGNETSIFDCTIKYGGEISTCDPSADAGVICQGDICSAHYKC